MYENYEEPRPQNQNNGSAIGEIIFWGTLFALLYFPLGNVIAGILALLFDIGVNLPPAPGTDPDEVANYPLWATILTAAWGFLMIYVGIKRMRMARQERQRQERLRQAEDAWADHILQQNQRIESAQKTRIEPHF